MHGLFLSLFGPLGIVEVMCKNVESLKSAKEQTMQNPEKVMDREKSYF